jgi:hypothetical protein
MRLSLLLLVKFYCPRRLDFLTLRLLWRLVLYCFVIITNISRYFSYYNGMECLKTNRSADHSTDTGTAARPAATDLALNEDIAVFIAESHATGATVALVIGVE